VKHVLRVVTFYRPWDWAIVHADKRVENRDRLPPFRPPWYMAVRSGKTWEGQAEGAPSPEDWPAGRVVGVAEVVSYLKPGEGVPGRWRNPESYGWVLGRVVPLTPAVVWPPPELLRGRDMRGLVDLQPERYDYDGPLLATLRNAWQEAAR
jgi:hypothetical protein